MPTTWDPEKIEQIPEVYRDFLLVLKPILDSRDAVLKIHAVPLSKVYNALQPRDTNTPLSKSRHWRGTFEKQD